VTVLKNEQRKNISENSQIRSKQLKHATAVAARTLYLYRKWLP